MKFEWRLSLSLSWRIPQLTAGKGSLFPLGSSKVLRWLPLSTQPYTVWPRISSPWRTLKKRKTIHACNAKPILNSTGRSEKAQIVLPLAKRVPLGLKYSYNWKGSHLLVERNAGIEFHSEMFNSEESIFPKSLYGRLSWALGPYHFDVFEVTSSRSSRYI